MTTWPSLSRGGFSYSGLLWCFVHSVLCSLDTGSFGDVVLSPVIHLLDPIQIPALGYPRGVGEITTTYLPNMDYSIFGHSELVRTVEALESALVASYEKTMSEGEARAAVSSIINRYV